MITATVLTYITVLAIVFVYHDEISKLESMFLNIIALRNKKKLDYGIVEIRARYATVGIQKLDVTCVLQYVHSAPVIRPKPDNDMNGKLK